MDDRELLELAAKAAGYKRLYEMPVARDRSFYMIEETEGDRFTPWNPITDDGASRRLQCDLKLDVLFFGGFQEVVVENANISVQIHQPYGDDIRASVRVAIVRAAAEIGRSIPDAQQGPGD